jgi:hypothetical protein
MINSINKFLFKIYLEILFQSKNVKCQSILVSLKVKKKLCATLVKVKLLNGSVLKTKTSVSAVIGASRGNSDQITKIKFNDSSLELN